MTMKAITTIVVVVTVFVKFSSANKPFECKGRSCDDDIRSCLKFMGSAIKGMEPMREHDQFICKVIEINGISSIRHNNVSCLTDMEGGKEGPCFHQLVQIRFEEIKIGCQLHSTPEETIKIIAAKSMEGGMDAAKKGAEQLSNMGKKIPGFGKRDAEGDGQTFFVNGSWTDLLVLLEMKLCFDDDVFEILDVKPQDENFITGLKLWCEGGEIIAKCCGAITSPEAVRTFMGMMVSVVAKMALKDALKDPAIGDNLTALNCGEEY